MNALQNQFADLEVVGVPCNQFGMQEQGKNGTEILNTLKYVRPGGGFEPNFTMLEKTEVNGENEHPLFTYLKSQCPPTDHSFRPINRLFYSPLAISDIRWNFEKFLINTQGMPVLRYDSQFHPSDLTDDIKHLLMEPWYTKRD